MASGKDARDFSVLLYKILANEGESNLMVGCCCCWLCWLFEDPACCFPVSRKSGAVSELR